MSEDKKGSKVYFSRDFDKLLHKLEEANEFNLLKDNVGIKLHFGEEGCVTFLNPKVAKAVYEEVSSQGKKASFIECNVLYKGSRTTKQDHINTAIKHGFGFAPIDILDGEKGEASLEIPVEDGLVSSAKVGKGITKYDSLVVLSHFKGHIAAGFGGAFKNLGMGLGSRAGKLHMHSDISPHIDREKCNACMTCINNCDVNAISLVDGKAKIDDEKCIGCAMCIAVCPQKAVRIPWGGSTNEELQKKIIDYSHALIDYFKGNLLYINVLQNITEECDCMGKKQEPITGDIGFLASRDPVALEQASLDLVEKQMKGGFDKINNASNSVQVDYAAQKGLGKKDYFLV
jgi:hypothetical protein